MRYKYFIFVVSLSFLFSTSGGYAGASYQYGSNARAIALSNSLVSNHNKGYNPFTNPALLGRESSKLEYGFSYFPMSLDRSIQTFSISAPSCSQEILSFASLEKSKSSAEINISPPEILNLI